MTAALILAGLVLAVVEQIRVRGQSVLCWAVILIGLALTLPLWR